LCWVVVMGGMVRWLVREFVVEFVIGLLWALLLGNGRGRWDMLRVLWAGTQFTGLREVVVQDVRGGNFYCGIVVMVGE
jgi:hypothetical protein